MNILSIITPFYARSLGSYLPERALDFVRSSYQAPWIERIIVDQGSPETVARPIREACEAAGIRYVNLQKGHLPFSIGLCRNTGVQLARGKYISFQDVDLRASDSMYEAIRKKLSVPDICFNHLEVIPCFYLSPAASEQYICSDSEDFFEAIYDAYIEGDASVIDMAAPATSCLLVNRHFYLSEGGVREEFFGHGYEDFELMNRLSQRAKRFYRSHDYYSHDYKYDSLEYKGYRTFFSMFGRQNQSDRIFYIHLHHETVADSGYKARNARNKVLFESFLKKYDENLDAPPALSDLNKDGHVLCIGSRTSLPFRSIRIAMAYLGKTSFKSEHDFGSIEEFKIYLSDHQITSVLFLTPYGNEERLDLYRWCRYNDFPFIVFDRGALPDSWFFDAGGFNGDSRSYSPEKWDRVLTEEETGRIEQYLHELCSSDTTLEANGERRGAHEFRRRFDLVDRRVVFVPLQRPKDSVIQHLSGNVDDIDHFLQQIKILSQILPQDWRIVVKQHPLESHVPDLPGVTVLPKDVHVYDAISAADAVVLVNSGVGLLSLCFNKPVYCFGKAFYSHEGLAVTVENAEELAYRLAKPRPVDQETVKRFIHYLVNDFYSFAKTQYKKVEEGSSSRNVAVHLDFSVLNLPGMDTITLRHHETPLNTKSPAYDYYRAYLHSVRSKTENKKTAPVKAPPVTAKPASPSVSKPPAPSVPKPPVTSAPKQPNTDASSKQATTNVVPLVQPAKAEASSRAPARPATASDAGSVKKKLRKLFRDPSLFFKDAARKRLA